ncbi:MAG: hypothetical protein KBF88_13815, partial [Polyangiaceae bacterium]|nr:hypothetical protein [Polyangiaceae bacterium]
MKSTVFSRWSSLIAAAFALAVSVPERDAFAQNANAENQAKALQKKAMEEDFLSVEFDKALDKLKQASNVCGDTKCPPLLRAQLKRDIGVVLVTGHSDKAKGEKAFVDAIRIDGSVAIDKDYRTPEVDAVFAEAKKKSGAGNSVINDFNHTPVPAQFVRTPVPVYVEYTGTDQLVRVIVRYKGFGMNEWKLLELHRISKGWGVSVPCDDVVQGNLLYFVQGYNAGGEAVALGGDKSNPFKVQIKNGSPDADAPHLPGEDAPAQCAEKQDCPPGFPCDKSSKKGGGATCEEDSECETGTCKEGSCTSPSGRTKIWLGLNVGADLYFLGGEQNVCALETSKDAPAGTALTPLNPTGYYCINSDGKDFPSRDDKGVEASGLNKPGAVDGGANLGNVRVMLAFDYAIKENMLLGVRAGYAFNTYPGQAA